MKLDRTLKHGILLVATFLALVPTIFMIATSLKSQEEYTFNKVGFPHPVVFDHFDNVLFHSPYFAWMGNSIILAAGAVALSTVVSCLGAYAIARMEFKGRGTLFSISTSLMRWMVLRRWRMLVINSCARCIKVVRCSRSSGT